MRSCRICKETLRGRSDQVFCSDQCRSHFHNLKNQEERKRYRRIHAVLRKNREILAECRSKGLTRINLSALEAFGFSRNFHTETIWRGREIEFRIYDLQFRIAGEILEITSKEPP